MERGGRKAVKADWVREKRKEKWAEGVTLGGKNGQSKGRNNRRAEGKD